MPVIPTITGFLGCIAASVILIGDSQNSTSRRCRFHSNTGRTGTHRPSVPHKHSQNTRHARHLRTRLQMRAAMAVFLRVQFPTLSLLLRATLHALKPGVTGATTHIHAIPARYARTVLTGEAARALGRTEVATVVCYAVGLRPAHFARWIV